MPFAVPYIAFLNQAGKLPPDETMGALVVYNIGYALPFLLVPVAAALAGPSIIPVFDRIMGWVEAVSGLIMPLLLGALGLAMIVDAVLFFWTGQGLI